MRKASLILSMIIGISTAAGIIAVASPGNLQSSTEPARPIPLAELHERGVQGRLGVPLGKIIEVSGIIVQNRSRAKAEMEEPFFLRIDQVDGHKLENPGAFSSTLMPLVRDVPGLKVGDYFHCIGYETGSFKGSPDGEFKYVLPYATEGFHFEIRFVVLKS